MGDMADMVLEQIEEWEFQRFLYRTGHLSDAEAYEIGLIDELGYELNSSKKSSGPGKCPKCDGDTYLVTGRFGKFYGCNKFPKCKGSRNY